MFGVCHRGQKENIMDYYFNSRIGLLLVLYRIFFDGLYKFTLSEFELVLTDDFCPVEQLVPIKI